MNIISDYDAHKRDEEWDAAEDRRLEAKRLWELERTKRELADCMQHERTTTGVDRRHWTEKGDPVGGEEP